MSKIINCKEASLKKENQNQVFKVKDYLLIKKIGIQKVLTLKMELFLLIKVMIRSFKMLYRNLMQNHMLQIKIL
jgi:hypothetical protein